MCDKIAEQLVVHQPHNQINYNQDSPWWRESPGQDVCIILQVYLAGPVRPADVPTPRLKSAPPPQDDMFHRETHLCSWNGFLYIKHEKIGYNVCVHMQWDEYQICTARILW
jgi:hypothetical protein